MSYHPSHQDGVAKMGLANPPTSVIPQGVGAPPPPGMDPKRGKLMCIKVRMLDDTVGVFHLGHKALGQALFDEVCRHLNLLECDYFGLEFLDCFGNHCWLDKEKPILRQITSSQSDARFYFVIKFYSPNPADLVEEYTRYLFALQIKRDLSSGQFVCHENTAALMVSYVVQSECGDFSSDDYPDHSYLNSGRFVPNQTPEFQQKVMENHRKLIGTSPAEADLSLLETARRCDFYGVKFTPAKDIEGTSVNLAVLHLGIRVFHQLSCASTFSWAKVRKLSFKRKKFLIKLHPESYQYYKDTIEFVFETRNESKAFWKKCVENHAFFRCSEVERRKQMQSSSFLTKGSSFRYYGKTQKQLIDYVREHHKMREPFTRPIHTSFARPTISTHNRGAVTSGYGSGSERSIPTPLLPVSVKGQNGDLGTHYQLPSSSDHYHPDAPQLHRKNISGVTNKGGRTTPQSTTVSFHFPVFNESVSSSPEARAPSPRSKSQSAPITPKTPNEGAQIVYVDARTANVVSSVDDSLLNTKSGEHTFTVVSSSMSDYDNLLLTYGLANDNTNINGTTGIMSTSVPGPGTLVERERDHEDNVSEDSYHLFESEVPSTDTVVRNIPISVVNPTHQEPVLPKPFPAEISPMVQPEPIRQEIPAYAKVRPVQNRHADEVPVPPTTAVPPQPKTYGATGPLPGRVLVRQPAVITADSKPPDRTSKSKEKPVVPPKPKHLIGAGRSPTVDPPAQVPVVYPIASVDEEEIIIRPRAESEPRRNTPPSINPSINVQSEERPDLQHKILLNGDVPYVLTMRHLNKKNDQIIDHAEKNQQNVDSNVPFSTFKEPHGAKTIPESIASPNERGRPPTKIEDLPRVRRKSLDLVHRKRLPSPGNFSSQDHSVSPTTPDSGNVLDYILRQRSASQDRAQLLQKRKTKNRNDQRRKTQPIRFSLSTAPGGPLSSFGQYRPTGQSTSQPELPIDPDYDSGPDDGSVDSVSLHEEMDNLEKLAGIATGSRYSEDDSGSSEPPSRDGSLPPPPPPLASEKLAKTFESFIPASDAPFIDDSNGSSENCQSVSDESKTNMTINSTNIAPGVMWTDF